MVVTEVKNKKRVEIRNNTEKEVFYIVKKKKDKFCMFTEGSSTIEWIACSP